MSELSYIRDLEQRVATLMAEIAKLTEKNNTLAEENTKLREWKDRAIAEYDPTCCGKCEDFIENLVDGTFCFVCQKYHCRQCWEGNYETLRRPDATGGVIDTFDVCHDCSPPKCGTCRIGKVEIFCPLKNCERSFCGMECYNAHCDEIDKSRE